MKLNFTLRMKRLNVSKVKYFIYEVGVNFFRDVLGGCEVRIEVK